MKIIRSVALASILSLSVFSAAMAEGGYRPYPKDFNYTPLELSVVDLKNSCPFKIVENPPKPKVSVYIHGGICVLSTDHKEATFKFHTDKNYVLVELYRAAFIQNTPERPFSYYINIGSESGNLSIVKLNHLYPNFSPPKVKLINGNLLYVEFWYGRVQGGYLVFDIATKKIIASENFTSLVARSI
jgi:hypothetical protein